MASDEKNKKVENLENKQEPKLYKKRWFILFLYVVACATSTIQWSQYTIIADVIVHYYKVPYEAVNWTMLTILVNLLIFAYPSCYIIDKYGVRIATLIAACGTCVASWIKVFATLSPNNFWVVILGQVVLTMTQVCYISIPPKLAAIWFGANEVSRACALGMVGIQIGTAFGFMLPPLLIKKETAGLDLFTYAVGIAISCSIVLIALYFFFTNKPPVPPSYAELKEKPNVRYFDSLKNLLKNIPFLMILLGIGINQSIVTTLETLLNQVILRFHPDGGQDAGWIGLCMSVFGIIGCIIVGLLLDKYKIYKMALLTLGFALVIALCLLTFAIPFHMISTYIIYIVCSIIYKAYWTVGLQIALETSYPEPEAVVFGISNVLGLVFGIGYTYLYSYMFYKVTFFWANFILATSVFISFVLMALVKFPLKRKAANLKKEEIKSVC